MRIHESGGLSIVQQFANASLNAYVVDFTPDSQYAIISFMAESSYNPNLWCYRIEADSRLTEVDGINLPEDPGEAMAVTPDGKYAITRGIISGQSLFYVVRIHENGTLEYLPQNDYVCGGYVSAIAFVPPRKSEAKPSWNMYQ
jgi:hypothetical protein